MDFNTGMSHVQYINIEWPVGILGRPGRPEAEYNNYFGLEK